MAWDSSRPVPWQRLTREWLIYVAVMAAILFIFFRDSGFVGALAGLLVSGPLYLAFGYVMAKFGYQRRSLKEMKTPQAKRAEPEEKSTTAPSQRPKPAPTRRTSGGGNRPKSKQRRR